MVEVVLRAVRVDVGSSTPLLLLEEWGENEYCLSLSVLLRRPRSPTLSKV